MIYLGNDVVFEEFSLHFHGAKVVKQFWSLVSVMQIPRAEAVSFIYTVSMV